MFHRRKELLTLRLALTDLAVTALAFELAYVLRQHLPALRLFYLNAGTMAVLLIASLFIWLTAGAAVGRYRPTELGNRSRTAHNILRQTVWSAAALLCLLYLVRLGDVSRLFMLLFVLTNLLLLLTCHLWVPAIGRIATQDTASRRHYVIVGAGETAAEVARLLDAGTGQSGEVLGFVREDGESTSAAVSGRIWEQAGFHRLLKDHVVDEVIFAVGRDRMRNLEDLFVMCQEEGVKVRVVVNFLPNVTAAVSLDRLHDLPLLTFSNAPDNDYLLFLKRALDILIAAAMLVAVAPAALLVVVAIRLTSPGPVFFVQERCGLNGRRFRLFKFRSMYADAEARRENVAGLNEMDGPVFKCANDPRITPLGRWLRKFSIDEWPQLVNVLKGDMSLVGPRPPLPQEVEQYKPWQRRRLRMRPGLTCLWVLEGRNRLDFLSWMRLDLHYIDHWSLALDCKILLLSIPQVLAGRGM